MKAALPLGIILVILVSLSVDAAGRRCAERGGDWVTHYWAKGAYHKCEPPSPTRSPP